MTTKLYQIKRIEDGKYFNAKDQFFTSKMCIGTYALSHKEIERQLFHFGLIKICETVKTTEEEFTQDMATMTTKAIIQAESLKKSLEEIRYILPTVSLINKNTGNFLTKAITHLKLISPMFNQFVKAKEDSTFDVIGVWDEFIQEISEFNLYDCPTGTNVLRALKKDAASINGIANKVNKYDKTNN